MPGPHTDLNRTAWDAWAAVHGQDTYYDAITLARHGARVTGVGFSPAALAKPRDLAARCGVAIDLVEGDATALPAGLRGRFDLAYATIGIPCWIDDVGAWMRSVAGTLYTLIAERPTGNAA